MARAKLTQQRLKEVLTARLGLTSPRFMLETLPGGKLSGSVVSDSFAGMKDTERQRRIWAALDAEFGPQSTNLVGTLLAYADREWDWNTELATK